MMYCEFETKGARDNGYGLSILTACDQFAKNLNRPELRHAPFVLWGHSMGGRVAQDFVRFKPSRVLAFHIALRANPSTENFMVEEAAAQQVPGLYLMGQDDGKVQDIREHFTRARQKGSPRAWVWLPGQAHWPKGMHFDKDETTEADWKAWAAHDVVIPWTEAIIRLRMPKDADPAKGPVALLTLETSHGWLGDIPTGWVAAQSRFTGSKSKASWFPNEETAEAWSLFCQPSEETVQPPKRTKEQSCELSCLHRLPITPERDFCATTKTRGYCDSRHASCHYSSNSGIGTHLL